MSPRTKNSLVELAYSRLKEEIRSNRMAPGYQAPEPEIADHLNMSRTPVREALIRLEAEGLVELIPRRGARILPISPQDMTDIYELLTALEPEAAAKLAQRRLKPDEIALLEEPTSRMEEALERKDLEAWANADDDFHTQLLQLHGNARLTGFVQSLLDQAHRARMITLKMRKLPVASTKEHRAIMDSLSRGDAIGTRNLFRRHRERASEELVALLNEYGLEQL